MLIRKVHCATTTIELSKTNAKKNSIAQPQPWNCGLGRAYKDNISQPFARHTKTNSAIHESWLFSCLFKISRDGKLPLSDYFTSNRSYHERLFLDI